MPGVLGPALMLLSLERRTNEPPLPNGALEKRFVLHALTLLALNIAEYLRPYALAEIPNVWIQRLPKAVRWNAELDFKRHDEASIAPSGWMHSCLVEALAVLPLEQVENVLLAGMKTIT